MDSSHTFSAFLRRPRGLRERIFVRMLTYVPQHRETPPLKSLREWVGNNDRIAVFNNEKFGTGIGEYMENGSIKL